jgi:hypothetical protein
MKSKIIYRLIRDQTIIDQILNLIISDMQNFKHTRIDKFSIKFYYDLNEKNGICFKVYNPIKNEKDIEK